MPSPVRADDIEVPAVDRAVSVCVAVFQSNGVLTPVLPKQVQVRGADYTVAVEITGKSCV